MGEKPIRNRAPSGTVRLLLITGMPGSGKTTLARQLAHRYGAPLLTKDSIKEPLLDVLGAQDPAASRTLSDASFAVMFRLARELLAADVSVLLEGNFRPGEHEPAVRSLLSAAGRAVPLPMAQILCRVDEQERLRRLRSRIGDPTRHSGHRDADLLVTTTRTSDAFLDLPGERFLADDSHPVTGALDHWWNTTV